ncbi:hypothetical protein GQE99_06575 [Maritimibacter sp. DP07]|uniref:Uncharacterized protein n=1 Tax=Maritimibacter harenae TaxID=2606218 RepID=A0A845M7W5_9RHOB|nr:hypothetical protein [Maritimibacter harenae]MZR12684.1 hypothetical protein [Maritimibacter harenae]
MTSKAKRVAIAQRVGREGIDHALNSGERTNADRVAEGRVILDLMHAMTGVDPAHDADGPQTAISDTLAQLFHVAHAEGLDHTQLIATALMHFDAEINEED